jgi:NNP family nitrate/nitrite transporter-like MFS transporter
VKSIESQNVRGVRERVIAFQSLNRKGLSYLTLFWFFWFLNSCGRTILAPILPLIEEEFHTSHARASSVVTLVFLGYAFSLFFSAVLSSRIGSRKIIAVYLAVSGIALLSVAFVESFAPLSLIGLVLGLSAGLYLPTAIPTLTQHYGERLWGRVICIHDSAPPTSTLVVPLVVLFFLSFMPWRTMFIFLAVPYFVCSALCAWKVEDTRVSGTHRYFRTRLMKNRLVWSSAVVWAFAAGAYFGIYFIIPLYLTKELGLPVSEANRIFGISRIGGMVTGICAGFFVNRLSVRRMALAFLVATGALTMCLVVRDLTLLKGFLFLQATVAPAFFPISIVFISQTFSVEERGEVMGYLGAFASVFGIGVVPYLLGLCGDLVGFRIGIFLLGFLTILSGGLLMRLRKPS